MEDQISGFKTDENQFNITVEQKLGMLDQFGKDNAFCFECLRYGC